MYELLSLALISLLALMDMIIWQHNTASLPRTEDLTNDRTITAVHESAASKVLLHELNKNDFSITCALCSDNVSVLDLPPEVTSFFTFTFQ